ncbi:MAG: hypothetical protein ACN0LA_07700 [Candidatus Longimicrobiales bacterium M2_2A_002]
MSQSPFQRFIAELRRRHVPQTAAIYLVAAWAAIEFADVVVPNLNGPQWVVTAVIVAALVGFPVMLVVAWIFEWGPDGIHRTEDAAVERMEAPGSYDPETGGTEPAPGRAAARRPAGGRTGPAARSQPWLAALAVLVVGIGSAVAVAYVLQGGGDGSVDASAPTVESREGEAAGDRTGDGSGPGASQPPVPPAPGMSELGGAFADSIGRQVFRALSTLDTLDLSGMAELRRMGELGRDAAVDAGLAVLIIEPREWRGAERTAPVRLTEGDTLRIRGVAVDTMGVAGVAVDGETLAEPEEPAETVPFTTTLVGQEGVGVRAIVITVRTADGRELSRTFQIVQLPGGTP